MLCCPARGERNTAAIVVPAHLSVGPKPCIAPYSAATLLAMRFGERAEAEINAYAALASQPKYADQRAAGNNLGDVVLDSEDYGTFALIFQGRPIYLCRC